MSKRICLAVALLLLGNLAATAEDYSALLDEAIENIEWETGKDWAFTETSLRDEQIWVGHYDPRMNDLARWTLVTVDGKEPTDEQRRKYRHDKDEHQEDGDDDDNRVTAIVEPDSLELVEETDEHWLFSFVPSEDEQAFTNSVDAMIKIRKDSRYVESLEIRNHQDIKPGYATKITRFQMRFSFGPAVEDGPIVPQSYNVEVKGRALLFIGFDETEAVKYSDYEYVGN